jgi:SAM-dependent methyltransferase
MALHPSGLLSSPRLYVGFQYAVGGARMRDEALRELALQDGERVLDLGCGPAYYMPKLPRVEYWGFDTDRTYVDWARSHWKDRGRFFDEPFAEEHLGQVPKFDAIMLMGLLHHLDDDTSDSLLALLARALAPGGRVVALETVVYAGQSAVARFFSKNDRGDFVRSPEHYRRLGTRRFASESGRIVGGFPFPTESYLMTLREPRSAD